MNRYNPFRLAILAAGFLALASAGLAGQTRVEEYARSGGGTAARTHFPPSLPPAAPPAIPKNPADLRFQTGSSFSVLQRDNYLVASNLDPYEFEYLVDGVLDFCSRALIQTYFDKGPVDAKVVNIYVFRDYDTYRGGLRRFLNMEPISPYGHYGHTQKYIVVNYETGPGTMVHELTHSLMSEDFPEAPIWLAEGMASLYEHCRAEGDVLRGDDNFRLPELQSALERGNLTPLPLLLAMRPDGFRGMRESLNYAQARYFCKYLEELGMLSGIYKEFRDRHHLDPTGARFVTKAFGKSLDVVEASWKRWISFQYWKE